MVLKRSLDENVTKRKSKGVRGILKSVHFGTFRNSSYAVMNAESDDDKHKPQKMTGNARKNKRKDESNGYSSVVFNIEDDSAKVVPSKADNDDYAIVNISGNNNPTTDIDDEPSDYAKVSTATVKNTDKIDEDGDYDHTSTFKNGAEAGASTSMEGSSDYAVVDKGTIKHDDPVNEDENSKRDNDQCDYAVVHKNRVSMLSENDVKKEKDETVITANDYINASLIKVCYLHI